LLSWPRRFGAPTAPKVIISDPILNQTTTGDDYDKLEDYFIAILHLRSRLLS